MQLSSFDPHDVPQLTTLLLEIMGNEKLRTSYPGRELNGPDSFRGKKLPGRHSKFMKILIQDRECRFNGSLDLSDLG